MLEQGQGSIVNIASLSSFSGASAGAAYTASKHALLGLTRSMAWRYAKEGIRCNAVAPGPTATEAWLGLFAERYIAAGGTHVIDSTSVVAAMRTVPTRPASW